MNDALEIKLFTPKQPISKEAQDQIDSLGLELFNQLQTFNHIRSEIELPSYNKPHVLYQLIKQFISVLSTQDPNRMHYEIAREILEREDPQLLENNNLVDIFARELCNHFKLLNTKLIPPKNFQELFVTLQPLTYKAIQQEGFRSDPSLDVLELPDGIDQSFTKNGKYIWDLIFCALLNNIGEQGKKTSKELKGKIGCDATASKEFWFNLTPSNAQFYLSKASLLLAYVVFEDIVKGHIPWATKYVPALTTKVQGDIKEVLSHKNKVKEIDGNRIEISHQDSLIGVSMPAISQRIFNIVFKGALKLNSVTGHRLIRHFPQLAFDRKSTGEDDYRVLKYKRGATEIAELLGLHGKQHVSNIKEIIHAMAYFQFSQNTVSGNLIQLSKYKSPTTHRHDEAYLITVGTPLLPYQTFRREDGGLLIPLLKDPPLVNPNQYHAHQYLLQMEIMGEFSRQSINLATQGSIQIPQHVWEEIASSCGINQNLLRRVLDRWTQDGNDAPKFLEQFDGDFYTLGKEHAKALDFLKEQGKIRERNSKRGRASVQKKSLINLNNP